MGILKGKTVIDNEPLCRDIFVFILSIFLFPGNQNKIVAQNLVPNTSFESFIDFSVRDTSEWHKVQESDTPDYFNFSTKHAHNNIFNKYMGTISPGSGDGFVGVFCYRVSSVRGIYNVREFIETRLLTTLEKDSLYEITLSVRLDTESNLVIKNVGVYFSESHSCLTPHFNPLNVTPQVDFDSKWLDSTDTWIKLSKLYKARGQEAYMVIGNFRTDRKTSEREVYFKKERGKRYKWDLLEAEKAAYYYIDDLMVNKITKSQNPTSNTDSITEPVETDSIFNIDKLEIDSAIVLKNIIFEFNKSDLLPQSYSELNRLKQFLITNPEVRIKLEGHTDNIGGYDFNLKLSIERVEAVANYLINNGIDASRIEFEGFSYSKPLAPNDTDEGRQLNRRVVFKILNK